MLKKTMPKMKLTFLGTGTSTGVPMIGCKCKTCTSSDPKDKRLRTSAHLEVEGVHLQMDVGPDFRQQMLRENINKIDGILITHEHNDHVIGLDEVRAFNFLQKKDMPVYATEQVQVNLKQRFDYIFSGKSYPGIPKVKLITITKTTPFFMEGIKIIPIEVMHGQLPILGFRVHDFTYITDIKTINEDELEKVMGTEVLVLSALHQDAHRTHQNLDEALALIEKIAPKHTYLTHISHRMGRYANIAPTLPSHITMAYDGLTIEI